MTRLKYPVPDKLSREEKNELAAWVKKEYPQYWRHGPSGIKALVATCLDYFRSTGNRAGHTKWVLVCKNWIRREAANTFEHKQQERPQHNELSLKEGGPLSEQLKLIRGRKDD